MLLVFGNMRQIPINARQLEDLYVKSEHRNKGIGKALFKELAIIAQEKVTALTHLFDHAINVIPRTALVWIGLFSR